MAADETVRTAVVIVHGMSEKHPMETLEGFAKTALRPNAAEGEKKWDYYCSSPDTRSTRTFQCGSSA
jgi:hypothetical protein